MDDTTEKPPVNNDRQLEEVFNHAFDQLKMALGEKEGYAPILLNVLDVIENTIDRTLDQQNITDTLDRQDHRDMILRAGLSEFITNSAIGRAIPDGADFYRRIDGILQPTLDTWNAKNAVINFKRKNKK